MKLNLPKFNKGTILLIHYRYDPLACIIRWFLNCEYNHCAWVYNSKYLIENKRNGVLLSPINKYLNKKSCYFIAIKPKLSIGKLKLALRLALEQKKKNAPWKFMVTFILVGLGWKGVLPRPTCSGFIADNLEKVGFHFLHNKKASLITPKDILNSKEVSIVI